MAYSLNSCFDPCDPMWPLTPTGSYNLLRALFSIVLTKFGEDRSRFVKVMTFLIKINIWTVWPHVTPGHQKKHNLYQRSLATSHVWVSWSCNVTLRTRSIFSENHVFDVFWPLWPLCDLWPHWGHTTCGGEGKCCCDQVWSRSAINCWSYGVFSENQYLTLVTPRDPGWPPRAQLLLRVIRCFLCMSYMIMQHNPKDLKTF